MAGVLQFTLGLEASKFLDTLGISKLNVLSLAGAGEMLKKVFENAFAQIEKGAALNHLSKRTGESVTNLFMLQKAFKAVGLDAEAVPSALFMMQKALGGINDMGEDTTSIFAKAGLSIESLKKAGGAGALQQILGKMSGMNQTSATAFAGHIFGRNEAASMVQASRSMKEFKEGMEGARSQGEGLQRWAAAFGAIAQGVEKLKAKLDPVFLVIAEKISPALKAMVDWVNAIDLKPLVDGISDAFDVFAEAFKEGKIMELLGKGFDAAVEYFGNMLFGLLGSSTFWKGIWDEMVGEFEIKVAVIAKAFLGLGTILQSAIETALNAVFELMGGRLQNFGTALLKLSQISPVGKTEMAAAGSAIVSLNGYKAEESFGQIYARHREEAGPAHQMLNGLFGAGAERYQGGLSGIGKAFAQAHANAGGPAQDAFGSLVDSLLGNRHKAARKGAATEAAGKGQDFNLGAHGHAVEATALEKMGFVMDRGSGLGPAETTARNTTTMKDHLGKIVDMMAGGTAAAAIVNAHAV